MFACLISCFLRLLQNIPAKTGRVAVLIVSAGLLSGCSSFSTSSLPSFGFGGLGGFGSGAGNSPDCGDIQQRLKRAHRKYARVLSRENPAIYLAFTGQLSRSMTQKHFKGIHQMTDSDLSLIVNQTRTACLQGHLSRADCRGANRLGRAYKPLVLVAREAHENYCGNRPIR